MFFGWKLFSETTDETPSRSDNVVIQGDGDTTPKLASNIVEDLPQDLSVKGCLINVIFYTKMKSLNSCGYRQKI